MVKINITSGELLNDILQARYTERFIPFNEAMIKGTYQSPLFSDEFIKERAKTHEVSETEYRDKLAGFLDLLNHLEDYNEIVLWFGDEPFCVKNTEVVVKALKKYGYQGSLVLNIVSEETGDILKQTSLQ